MKKTTSIRLVALLLALLLCMPAMASAAKVRSTGSYSRLFAEKDITGDVIDRPFFFDHPGNPDLPYVGDGWYSYRGGYVPAEDVVVLSVTQDEATPEPSPTPVPTMPGGGTYPPAPTPTPNPNDISGKTDPEYKGEILRYTVPAGGLWLYNSSGAAVTNVKAGAVVSLTRAEGETRYTTYRDGTTYYVRASDLIIADPTAAPNGTTPVNPQVRSVVIKADLAEPAKLYADYDAKGVKGSATGDTLSQGKRVNVTPINALVYGYALGSRTYYLKVEDTGSPSSAAVVGGDQTNLVTKINIKSGSTIKLYYTQNDPSAYDPLKPQSDVTLYGTQVDSTWYQVKYGSGLYYILKKDLADLNAAMEQVADNNNAADGTFSLTIGSNGAKVYSSTTLNNQGQPSGTQVATLAPGSTVLAGSYDANWYTYVRDAQGTIGYIYRGDLSDAANAGSSTSLKVFLDSTVPLYDKVNTKPDKNTSIQLAAAYYVVKPLDDTWYAIVYGGATYYIRKADVPQVKSVFFTAGTELYDSMAQGATKKDTLSEDGYYTAKAEANDWYFVLVGSAQYYAKKAATASGYSALKIPAEKTVQLSENILNGSIISVTGPITLYVADITESENAWGTGDNFYKTTYKGQPYLIYKSHLTDVLGSYSTDATGDIDELPTNIATTGKGKSYYIVIGAQGGRLYQDAECETSAPLSLSPGEVVLATYYTSSLYQVGAYYLPVRYVASVRNGDDAAAVNPETPDDGIDDVMKGETDDGFKDKVFSYRVPTGGLWVYADAQANTPVLSLAANTTVQMTLYSEGATSGTSDDIYTLWHNGRQYYVKASALNVAKNDASAGQAYSITLASAVKLSTVPVLQGNATANGPTLAAGSQINVRVYANNRGGTNNSDKHIIYAYTHVDGNTYYFRDPAVKGDADAVLGDDINTALVAGNTEAGLVTKLMFKGKVVLRTKPEPNSNQLTLSTTVKADEATLKADGTVGIAIDDPVVILYGVKYGSEGWYKVAHNGAAWYVKPAAENIARQLPVSGEGAASTYTVVVGAGGAVYFTRPDASYEQGSTTNYMYDVETDKLAAGTTVSASLYNPYWYTFAKNGNTYYLRVTQTANTSANDAVSSYRITVSENVPVYNTISEGQNALGGLELVAPNTYVLRKVNANWSSVMLGGKTYYVKNAELSQADIDKSTPIGSTSLGKTYTLTVSTDTNVYNNSRLTGTAVGKLAGGTTFTGTKSYVADAEKGLAPDGLVFKITYGNLSGYIAANKVGGVLRGDEADEAQNAGNGSGAADESKVSVGTQVTRELRTGEKLYTSPSLTANAVEISGTGSVLLTKVNADWYSTPVGTSTYYIPASVVAQLGGNGTGSGGSGMVGGSASYPVPYNTYYYGKADDSLGTAGSIPRGITLTVEKISDSWYQSTYAGQTIFLRAAHMDLTLLDSTNVPTTPGDSGATTDADGKILTATIQVSISSTRLNMRREPGIGKTIVAYVPANTVLPNNGAVKDANGSYWYSTVFNGKTGYVSGNYVKPVGGVSQGGDNALGLNPENDMGRSLAINVDSVNIRAGAGTKYSILGQMTKGQPVSPTSYEVGTDGMYWYAFSFKGYTGYIRADYLAGSVLSSGLTGNAAVRAGGTNMRTGAGETFRLVTSLPRDKVVTIVGSGSDSQTQLWYQVTVDGQRGYIRADMLRPLTVEEKNQLIDEVAATYTQLKRGSKGAAVMSLQQRLIQLGFLAAGEADGIYGAKTETAVRAFQVSAGLTANGVASQGTQVALFGGTHVAQGDGTKKLEWFKGGMELIKQYPNVVVYDIESATQWNAKYINGSSHADVVPASSADAKRLVANNVTGSYVRRPVLVTINGQDYAGSMYAVGHGSTNYVSYFSGVMCIHFTGSMTHGSDKVDEAHQNAIEDAMQYGNK